MAKNAPHRSKNPLTRLLRITTFAIGILFILAGLWFAKLLMWDVPWLRIANPRTTSYIRAVGATPPQVWVPLPQISPNLIRAIIASEDGRFFEHNGIDIDALRNSWNYNKHKGHLARGGSTLTMQLARNLFLSRDKSYFRKAAEIAIAWYMEHQLTKGRILELYCNVVEWGDDTYGIAAASELYFHTLPAHLSSSQAAFLAAILPNPKKWGNWPAGPYVARRMRVLSARLNTIALPEHLFDENIIPEIAPPDEVIKPETEKDQPAVIKRAKITKPNIAPATVTTPQPPTEQTEPAQQTDGEPKEPSQFLDE